MGRVRDSLTKRSHKENKLTRFEKKTIQAVAGLFIGDQIDKYLESIGISSDWAKLAGTVAGTLI